MNARTGTSAGDASAKARARAVTAPLIDFAIVAGLAALLGIAAAWRWFLPIDGLWFDAVTRAEAPRPPRVVVVTAETGSDPQPLVAAARAQGLQAIGFDGPAFVGRSGRHPLRIAAAPANPVLPADHGIVRTVPKGAYGAFLQSLAGRDDALARRWIRMPEAQNILRLTGSQFRERLVAPGELGGFVAIVTPPRSPALATSLDPSGTATDRALFAAYAVQTLLDRREVRLSPAPLSVLVVLAAVLLGFLTASGGRPWHRGIGAVGAAAALVIASIAVLLFANLLLPATAMLLGLALAVAAGAVRRQSARDRRLEATLERAIDLAFARSLFPDNARVPEQFDEAAEVLGLPRAAAWVREGTGKWEQRLARPPTAPMPDLSAPAAKVATARLRAARRPAPAGVLAPGWGEDSSAVLLPQADDALLLLYELPAGELRQPVGRILGAAMLRLRAMRDWQHRLLATPGRRRGRVSIESRLQSAANLVTVQGDELASGLDALDTGVFVFRPLGTPIHANRQMTALLETIGEVPARSSLIGVLTALTERDPRQAASMVRAALLDGVNVRVPMRDIGARQRVLRLGVAGLADDRMSPVVVLEAVDITELDRLAQLRLAVGTFIDRQLRNDLEAVALGAAMAGDPRVTGDALTRIVGRIAAVAERATARLEDMRTLLDEDDGGGTAGAPCYPIEAGRVAAQAATRAAPFAGELGVDISTDVPAIDGFSLAEPLMLSDMIENMLRIMIADTASGGTVRLALSEAEGHTDIALSGGFGLPFDRFCAALDAAIGDVPVEYKIVAAGIEEALRWQGTVSYWSAAGRGFRFNIKLRRV